MTSPIAFPDWMPPWAQLLVLIVGILLVLAFLMMPFSVFGLKSRLEGVEARLDEIQGEIRALALRLPETPHRAGLDEGPPPIPPAAWAPDAGPRRPIGAPGRVEPRIGRGT
jgi:hypothetical protein